MFLGQTDGEELDEATRVSKMGRRNPGDGKEIRRHRDVLARNSLPEKQKEMVVSCGIRPAKACRLERSI